MDLIESILSRVFGRTRGFVSIEWSVINPIAPAHYQFFIERKIPTVRITVKSTWKKPIVDFEVQARLQEVSDWVPSTREQIKEVETIDMILPLPEGRLHSYEERKGIFELKCRYREPSGRIREYSDTKLVRVLSKDDMIWSIKRGEATEDLKSLIAAWVTPHDKEVQKIVHESAQNPNAKSIGGIVGYQETQHIWEVKNTVTIAPGTHYPFKLHLRQGSQVNGTLLSVSGGAGNDVNFGFLDCDGMISFTRNPNESYGPLQIKRAKTNHTFSYSTPIEGDYYLLFDNSFSSLSGKQVDFSLYIITPISHDEIVWYQIKAVYETVQRRGFSYVNTPISYAPGDSQRVKRPSETIEMKGGNCIDATVLFASCFEAMALDVFIILLPALGHSLVAVRTWPDSSKFFILETTIVGSATFEESLRIGEQTWRQQQDNSTWISIGECRKQGIKPFT